MSNAYLGLCQYYFKTDLYEQDGDAPFLCIFHNNVFCGDVVSVCDTVSHLKQSGRFISDSTCESFINTFQATTHMIWSKTAHRDAHAYLPSFGT
jgi:hypothetical protein